MEKTLDGFDAVTKVKFFPDKEQFEVFYNSDSPMSDEFKEAVRNVIIFPGVRRFLGGIGDQLHNSPEGRP